jgi:hypothetical protein
LVAVLVLASWASPAFASNASITHATASWNWIFRSAAGTVEWTDCPPVETCYWRPYLSVQPDLPEYECSGAEAFENGIDPNLRIPWMGAARASNGAESFDLPSFELVAGVPGQRLCLSVVYFETSPGYGVTAVAGRNLAGMSLEPEPGPGPRGAERGPPLPPLFDPAPPAAATTVPAVAAPPAVGKRRCAKAKRLVRRGGTAICRKRRSS